MSQQLQHLSIAGFIFMIYLNFANAQCSIVNSTTSPLTSICASLHIYRDQTYSQRLLNPELNRDSWVFAAIVTNQGVSLAMYDCWLTTDPSSGEKFHILKKGCPQEIAYYTEFDYARGVHKLYGKFLLPPPESVNSYYLQCDISTKCPGIIGCLLICNQPRDQYIVTSAKILDSASVTNTTAQGTTETRVDLVIVLIVVAASFFLIFLVLLIILICSLHHRRRRRRRERLETPVLINSSTTNDNVYQNGHHSTNGNLNGSHEPADVYGAVNRNSKGASNSTNESNM
ncbi:uncharacterized protein LOC120339758 isoform X1 [Styela clava]